MTRESRDPLSVLRETVKIAVATVYDESIALQIADEAGEAIAQVEALAEAAQEVIDGTVNATTYPDGPCIARRDREQLIAALAPFTPTDSEGGGHA